MAPFADLPDDVIIHGILPHLDSVSIDNLGSLSKRLNVLTNDQAFWRRKIRLDFGLNFNLLFDVDRPSFGFARSLWKGLRNPRVYVWGSTENHRSGIPQRSVHLQTFRTPPGVPYPVEITSVFKSATNHVEKRASDNPSRYPGLVELKSGGFSFVARDSDGSVWVWGQMDASFFGGQWDFASASKRVVTPTRLGLPFAAKHVSIGRRHILLLDEENQVWEMRCYGRAYRHLGIQPSNPPDSPSRVLQAEAGWNWSICLTENGKIHAWWPFLATYDSSVTPEAQLDGPLPGNDEDSFQPYSESSVIPVKRGTVGPEVPFELPLIPTLQETDVYGSEEHQWSDRILDSNHPTVEDPLCVVAVGAGDGFCAALRANGELWVFELKENEAPFSKSWRYLPQLSGPDIRHVSASFNSITSYSATKACSVKYAELSGPNPEFTIVQSPSGMPVRKVVMGDYHSVACDHVGAAFAWGENTAGQLGRGEMGSRGVGDLYIPALISFGKGDESLGRRISATTLSQHNAADRLQRDAIGDFKPAYRSRRFVFDVAAGGWQSGALVVDLQDYCLPVQPLPTQDLPADRQLDGMDPVRYSRTSNSPTGSGSPTVIPSNRQSGLPDISDFEDQTAAIPRNIAAAAEDDRAEADHIATDLEHTPTRGVTVLRDGLRHIRIGYAGRGAMRGRSGMHISRGV
ncbi:hypothetical protein QFC22_000943 [Naganishia vaughanmartiniae]|uniref:Uncharacterized protein n=1 Tax=Naganishia vaughanmartiniae TaxID=1424756 RepID=A0ACC2XKH1_9TREE|nr:hypothetical protein QFC22_000943 [Naganishia vaughanmartiniae]